jgi:hypothetical protein
VQSFAGAKKILKQQQKIFSVSRCDFINENLSFANGNAFKKTKSRAPS